MFVPFDTNPVKNCASKDYCIGFHKAPVVFLSPVELWNEIRLATISAQKQTIARRDVASRDLASACHLLHSPAMETGVPRCFFRGEGQFEAHLQGSRRSIRRESSQVQGVADSVLLSTNRAVCSNKGCLLMRRPVRAGTHKALDLPVSETAHIGSDAFAEDRIIDNQERSVSIWLWSPAAAR